MSTQLEVQFSGVTFRNPILVASTDIGRLPGTFEAFAKAGVGGIVTKSVTDAQALQQTKIARFDIRDMAQHPVRGDPPDQYYFFSRGGSMISMEEFRPHAAAELAIAKREGVVAIGSISAAHKENWVAYAQEFEAMGYPMLELNFGNPHGEAAGGTLGFLIGQSPELCISIATAVMAAVSIPIVVKLTPQVADLTALCSALKAAGIRAVTVTHRFQGLVIDRETQTPVLGGFAAIGGPWMKPLTLASIAKVYRATGMDICGSNGADTAEDVLDFLYAGAAAVQIGSSMMLRGPAYAKALVAQVQALADRTGAPFIGALKGRVADRIVTYKNLGELSARRAAFRADLCADCLEKPCVARCYFGALDIENGTLIHREDFCSGCGMCLHICPQAAVEINETQYEKESQR